MDNAGGSQILGSAVENISEYFLKYNVQLGASYKISSEAGKILNGATGKIADFINAPNPKEVVLGPSSTMLLRILSLCISRQWKAGDEVIVTNSDHEANVSCWTDLAENGIKIKIWKVNPNSLELETEELKKLLSSRTKLVAVTHASNILGTINPVKEIAEIVHEAGALICVDGVAFAPHRQVDVQKLDVDFYIFSWYKVYGPHSAVMFGKLPLLTQINGINHYFFKAEDVPYKFQPGNFNFEMAYAASAIPEYFEELHDFHFGSSASGEISKKQKYGKSFQLIAKYEEQLSRKLLSFLNSVKEVKIIGKTTSKASERVPTISFIHEDLKSSEIVKRVDEYNIGIRFGDFYAKKLIHDLNLEQFDGVVRVSLVHYNTEEELEKLISVLKKIFSEAEK